MLTRMAFASIVALIAFGAFALFAPPGADAATSWWEQIDETPYDTCNGETIRITGRVHYTESTTSDGDGGYHVSHHSNSSVMTGVGQPSGNTYNASISSRRTYNARPFFPVVYRLSESVRFVPTGSGNPVRCSRHFTYQVNGNGTLVHLASDPYSCACP